jgi:hypothetical protein
MAAMNDRQPPRRRLFPARVGQVQLYHRERILLADVGRCTDLGWDVIEFDTRPWIDEDDFHDDLTAGLGLPPHYGRNLDALSDMAQDMATGRYGFPAHSVGGVLVLRRVDVLAEQSRSRLGAVLDIFVAASTRGLQHGWPLAILLQSDDLGLRCDPVAPIVIDWNPTERSEAGRTR